MAHFDVPLNLSHAATIAFRLVSRLSQRLANPAQSAALAEAQELADLLSPFRMMDPDPSEELELVSKALAQARLLVSLIESEGVGSDRVGQSVRNLFECLGAGKEGAAMGLKAGEDPNSLQRPV